MNVLLINARSLAPKLISLVDTMEESNGSLALITETWLKRDRTVDQYIQNMADGFGYGCIRRDRQEGNGGGVAIVFNTAHVQLQQIKTGGKHEIVAAVGRRTGQRRKLVVINAYIPPAFDADASDAILARICELVGTFKRRYNSPYFIVGGDFNKRQIERELRAYPDLSLVKTPPTRGNNTLDLLFTNFPQFIRDAGVTEPIKSIQGVQTDHKTVYMNSIMPRVPQYEIQKYTYLKQTPEGDTKLKEFLCKQDWKTVFVGCQDSTCMVERMHAVFEKGMEECYDRKSSTKKTSEPPWITGGIRRLIKRRRAVFRKFGRNRAWKILKKKTKKIIKEGKEAYNKKKKEGILDGSSKKFHQCVRAFINDDKSKEWNPRNLYPDLSEQETADRLALFFNNISSEYTPLNPANIPKTYDVDLPVLTPESIVKEIKEGKKTRSRVDGDIFVNVLVDCIDTLAVPICEIYNRISCDFVWPVQWKTEHVTVIPKTPSPETEAECRNISCTNFLSKVYERIVMRWCCQYVTPKQNQYGGQKGCSTYHFLAETMDHITDHLEDSRAASVLTSIDYSKAFNRIEHEPLLCLLYTSPSPRDRQKSRMPSSA